MEVKYKDFRELLKKDKNKALEKLKDNQGRYHKEIKNGYAFGYNKFYGYKIFPEVPISLFYEKNSRLLPDGYAAIILSDINLEQNEVKRKNFNSWIFVGRNNFRFTKFSNNVEFSYSLFVDETDFSYAVFNNLVSFFHAEFNERVSFDDSTFDSSNCFSFIEFKGCTSFERVRFKSDTDFKSTEFNGILKFNHAEFNGRVYFEHTIFNDKVQFRHVEFNGNAGFFADNDHNFTYYITRFNKFVIFSFTSFNDYVWFNSVLFNKPVNFSHTQFNGHTNITNVIFDDKVYFEHVEFNSDDTSCSRVKFSPDRNDDRKAFLSKLPLNAKLMYAAEAGYTEVVKHLLLDAVNVNTKDILITSTEEGHIDILRFLLNNIKQEAFALAAKYGHKHVMEFLIRNGIDINAKDRRGWTALMNAAYFGNKMIVEFLLSNDADLTLRNEQDKTALDLIEEGRPNLLTDCLSPDNDAIAAAYLLEFYGFTELAKYLLNNRDNVKTKINCRQIADSKYTEIKELLKQAGAKKT